jgi:hypothetical protein
MELSGHPSGNFEENNHCIYHANGHYNFYTAQAIRNQTLEFNKNRFITPAKGLLRENEIIYPFVKERIKLHRTLDRSLPQLLKKNTICLISDCNSAWNTPEMHQIGPHCSIKQKPALCLKISLLIKNLHICFDDPVEIIDKIKLHLRNLLQKASLGSIVLPMDMET